MTSSDTIHVIPLQYMDNQSIVTLLVKWYIGVSLLECVLLCGSGYETNSNRMAYCLSCT